ncbi:MAG TPA: hypothetical protein VNU28_01610, partial [Solirubrobacteraceae bacterium]|nr:hypothetical protein [Solirubrobacteraceae bacterium]
MRSRGIRFDPSICGLRLTALYALYREHWRYYRAAELMAGFGIAVGVSLVLGVLVANGSLLGSTREALDAIDGSASLKLVARSSNSFSEGVVERASRLPGVALAVPV